MKSIDKHQNDITRREFVQNGASTALCASAAAKAWIPEGIAESKRETGTMTDMRCLDIATHFRSRGSWVDWGSTTDTFKTGDPSKPVRRVAVAWKASWDALREAVNRGADLFVSHESICVNAENGSPDPEIVHALPTELPKFEWLEETGLVVYRCHDFWDRYPNEGIRDSWQRGLDIGAGIVADEYPLYVTEIEPTTVRDLANHVLRRISPLRQNGVMVSGDLDRRVNKVATGTGVTNKPVKMIELGANVGILTDDYYLHVRMGVHAGELDFPTIVVNHGVAEEWGIRNLAAYMRREFPELEVFHIPQYCPYTVLVDS
ncbi:Nif3-like dinuclear metal center hexameric protein [Gemmatimonadota bacterium]